MHVVASPVVVAVALGLLNPIALEDDETVEDGPRAPERKPDVLDAKFAPAE